MLTYVVGLFVAVIGGIAGLLACIPVAIALWIVVGIATRSHESGVAASDYAFFLIPIGAIIGFVSNFFPELKELQEKKKEKEKVYQEDRKYNLIINCPLCLGNGECMIINEEISPDGEYWVERQRIHKKPDEWSLRVNEETEEGDFKVRRKSKRGICYGCKGEGVAYAYFTTKEEKCSSCDGKGTIVTQWMEKKEIGAERKEKSGKCITCHGKGNLELYIVCVKTLNKEEFEVILNDENQDFYSVSKNRFDG